MGLAGSTNMSVEEIASNTGLAIGDLYSFLQQVRWLTCAVMVIADTVHMHMVRDLAERLLAELDRRFKRRGDDI
jgi:hypothetical protein